MLRAAAIALPRALLAGACYGGSLLARIAGKACSAYALRREWRAVVRALDDRMLRDIGLGRSGDRIRNLRQRSRERIALARISRHECQALFDRGEPRSAVGQSRRIDTAPAVAACPLRPSKRTSRACLDMSVKCQSLPCAIQQACSYSITSSAATSNVCGIIRPSAFAVLRLIARLNFVACWTGSSAGRAPFRIRPT